MDTNTTNLYEPSPRTTQVGDDLVEIAPLRFANLLMRRWRIVVLLPIAAVLGVLAVALFSARTYTARASFIPQASQSSQSQLTNIAARFGIDVGGPSTTQSPALYKTLLESSELLERVAKSEFSVPGAASHKAPLSRLLDVDEPTAARELYSTVGELRDITSVDVSTLTGVVEIRVRAESDTLSVQIARRMIDLVNEFNLRTRQEQASAERAFMQSRLDDARSQLRVSENELQSFLLRNRQYQGDPQLVFAYDRLRRDVEMKQGIYTTLAQGYEQAAIDAARDTPLITVIQQPKADPVPDSRRLVVKLLLAILMGAVVGSIGAAVVDSVGMARYRYPTDFEQFQQLRRQLWHDLMRLVRRRSRRAAPSSADRV
jgi:uncharacterized protein involved in exopolysaccharide biosynthesis